MLGRRNGDNGLIGSHVHGPSNIQARVQYVFDAESDRWSLWVPVCFAIGIGAYFSLSEEPSKLTGIFFLLPSLCLCIVCRARPYACAVSIALFCIALGFADAAFRTALVSAPRLEGNSRAVTMNAWVEGVERRHPSGYRLTLRPIPGNDDARNLPHRVRITSRIGKTPGTGQEINIRAVLRPIPEPVQPRGFDFARKSYYSGIGAVGFAISEAKPVSSKKTLRQSSRYAAA